MKVGISSDSTCDLPREITEKYDIGITPLYVVMDGTSLKDGVDVTPEEIYRHVDGGGSIPGTAAVSVQDYLDFFSRRLETYDAIVHFHISSGMSGCYQNACTAAAELGNVYPVDSENLSTGIAHLVLDAAEMAQTGARAAEIAAEMNKRKKKLDVSFLISTLSYLTKGGRCSPLVAMGANLLSLRPCIEVHNGAMNVGKKYRGNMDRCLEQYVTQRLEKASGLDLRRIFITESGALPDSTIEMVRSTILKYQPFAEIIHTRAGCTVSTHCGPGTLGILYYREKVRS